MQTMGDAELLQDFLDSGSQSAMGELIRRHAPMVRAACLRGLGGDEHQADDAVQAVFMILVRKAPSQRGRATLAPWLFRTATFVVLRMRREAARRRKREVTAAERREKERAMDQGEAPRWDEARDILNEALGGLRAKQRDALVLHYLEGMPRKDAARALGCSEEAIQKRIAYGLQKIRQYLTNRGVAISSLALAAGLEREAATAVPERLIEACMRAAMSDGAAGAAGPIAQGTMKMMTVAKVKTVAIAACLAAGLGVSAFVLAGGLGAGGDEKGAAARGAGSGATFYVSARGRDTWSGKRARPNADGSDGPFATLEAARDAVRKLKAGPGLPKGGVIVEIRGGVHRRDRTFALDARDAGLLGKPVVYRGEAGSSVSLTGGVALDAWTPVRDPALLERLPAAARGHVLQADLRAAGFAEVPRFLAHCNWSKTSREMKANPNGAWLSFKGEAMALASWPNHGGGDPIRGVPADSSGEFRGEKANTVGKFFVDRKRAAAWARETDLWCRGYFAVTYADDNAAVKRIDAATGLIELEPPYHYYGYKADNPDHDGRRARYAIANALCELDRAGEFRIDRAKGVAYFWPPSDITPGDVQAARLAGPLVEVRDAAYVTIRGVTLESNRGVGVRIQGGSHVRLEKCVVRNTGRDAVQIAGGTHHAVVGCDISGAGSGGVNVEGGDRKTLTSCHHLVDNCHIRRVGRWERTYKPAVNVKGVGVTTRNCLIHDLPHVAYLFHGNENVFAYNEIHSVARETTEAGAIYTGRDWTYHGNRIDYNYVHDLYGPHVGRGLGVHLDDAVSGISFTGNIFHRVCIAIAHCGGRYITVRNNLFLDCSAHAYGAGYRNSDRNGTLTKRLKKIPYETPPWRTKYPQLLNTLEDAPTYPMHSVITNNICYGGRFISWSTGDGGERDKLLASFEVKDNFWSAVQSIALERTNGRLAIDVPDEAIAVSHFEKLPLDEIGLHEDDLRATWPIENKLSTKPVAWLLAEEEERPVARAVRANGRLVIDGAVSNEEWRDYRVKETWGVNPNDSFVIDRRVNGKRAPLSSTARVRHDDRYLYVAVDSLVDPKQPLQVGETWGRCDAVEIAIQNPDAGGQFAPVIVLRGYASGRYESSDEAGAPKDVVARAARGVAYRARVKKPDSWSCEWRIPFSSLGIDPRTTRSFPFNITVRKTGGNVWLMWRGTRMHSWRVDQAGDLELVD